MVDIMKEMGYDAIGLGNHEFDFGTPHLTKLVEENGLPVVNMNLRSLHPDSLFFTPYIIKDFGGKKIAFVGVVTPESLISEAVGQNKLLCAERNILSPGCRDLVCLLA